MAEYDESTLHALAQIPEEGIPLSQLPEDGVAQKLQDLRLARVVTDPNGGRLKLSFHGRKALGDTPDAADTAVLDVPIGESAETSADDLLLGDEDEDEDED
jgi:hypothetical protein